MSFPDPKMLEAVGAAMVAVAPAGWQRLKLDVMAAAAMVDTGLEAEMHDGSTNVDVMLELDGLEAVENLRAAMYAADTGTWYLATITVTDDGSVQADFNYDDAPYGGVYDGTPDGGNAEPDLLIQDHEMYPRSPENLPAWHPARADA